MEYLYDINEYDDDRHRRSGLWLSVFIHLLLLLLFLAPLFNNFPKTNEEFKGVLVVFGEDTQSDESSQESLEEVNNESNESSEEWEEEDSPSEAVENIEKEKNTPKEEPLKEEVIEEAVKKEAVELPAVFSKVLENDAVIEATDQEKEEKKLEEQKKQEELRKQQEEKKAREAAERKEQKEREEAQKQIEATAQAKKEQEAKAAAEKARRERELEEKKKQYGDLFNNGSGDSDNDSKKGNPIGDPDGAALEGISTGQAEIGGGLSDRGVAYEPAIKDNSQKAGKVVIRVCVDQNGKVIEAKYTQRGSNTTDRTLVEIAEAAALKYTFTSSDIDKQCGTIAIDFKLK